MECRISTWSRLRVSWAADCNRAFLWSKQSLYFVMLTENTSILNLLFRLIRPKDLFLQLWKIISFNLEINSSESWRLIWGAMTRGWISLNYLSIRFISIHIIHIRFVWWTPWGWPWSERFPWTWHGRSGIGNMESAWPVPKIILHKVKFSNWEFKYFLYNFRFVIWYCNDGPFSFEIIQGFGWIEIYSPEVVKKVFKLSIGIL